MATTVKYIYGTEAQILALTSASSNWLDKAFYYPTDKPYFYQVMEGVMKKYGGDATVGIGIGVTLNDKVIGGVKTLIESTEILNIPEYYDYNTFKLSVEGTVRCFGLINML